MPLYWVLAGIQRKYYPSNQMKNKETGRLWGRFGKRRGAHRVSVGKLE